MQATSSTATGNKFCHDLFERIADRFNVIKVIAKAVVRKTPPHLELHEQAQIEFEGLKHKYLTNLEEVIIAEAGPAVKDQLMPLIREVVSEIIAMTKHDILVHSDENATEFDYEDEEEGDDDAEEASGFVHNLFGKCGQALDLLKIATEYFKLKSRKEAPPKLSWTGYSDIRSYYDFLITDQLPEDREYVYSYANRRRIVKLITLLKNHVAFQHFDKQYKIRTNKDWKPGYDTAFADSMTLQNMKRTNEPEGEWDTVVNEALDKLKGLNDALNNANIVY
jgi:hypothetical protein